MPLFEINKIAGALLAAFLSVGVATTISNLVYPEQHVPEILLAGFESTEAQELAEDDPSADEGLDVSIAERLVDADAAIGERAAKKCATCHTFAAGEPGRVGPDLHGLVSRPMGARADFRYSAAMSAQDGSWDYESLDAFLADPKGYVPGTSMAFAGVSDPETRAAIIAWLRLQADSPVPLPTP